MREVTQRKSKGFHRYRNAQQLLENSPLKYDPYCGNKYCNFQNLNTISQSDSYQNRKIKSNENLGKHK